MSPPPGCARPRRSTSAERLGLVYDMVAHHELGAVRLGRRIVNPVRALEAVLGGPREADGRGYHEVSGATAALPPGKVEHT